MTWFGVLLVIMFALQTGYVVGNEGKPRKPYDGGDIVIALLANGLLVWGVIARGV